MTETSEKIKKFNKKDEDYLKLYSIENLEEYKKYCIYDIQLYNYVCEKQNMQSFKINFLLHKQIILSYIYIFFLYFLNIFYYLFFYN